MRLNLNHEYRIKALADITETWGKKLEKGDCILDVGCYDGKLANELARRGFFVIGVDSKKEFIEAARERTNEFGTSALFTHADFYSYIPSREIDALVSFRTFYKYIRDPEGILARIAPFIKKKIVLDIDPRTEISYKAAQLHLEKAGFKSISARPLFIPTVNIMPRFAMRFLRVLEKVPILNSLILHKKFTIVVVGEK